MKASSFWSRLCLGRQASSSVMVDWTIGLVVEMVTLSFWKNRFSLLTMTMPRMPDNMCVMAMKANVCTWRNRPPATALFWHDASSPNSMMIAGHLWRSESTALWRESHQTEHGCCEWQNTDKICKHCLQCFLYFSTYLSFWGILQYAQWMWMRNRLFSCHSLTPTPLCCPVMTQAPLDASLKTSKVNTSCCKGLSYCGGDSFNSAIANSEIAKKYCHGLLIF